MVRIAAVDIGSNSVLMTVGEPLPQGDFRIVYESARTTRLGAGLDRTGRLSPGSVRRTLEALEECRLKARLLDVAMAKAAATAAVREAGNREDFLEPARRALGFGVEVASGEREAWLTFLGVAGKSRKEPLLILDVGGASTEFILTRDGRVERTLSLPIGAARLKEQVPSEDLLRTFVQLVRVLPDDLGPATAEGRETIVVGGTATTLAAMRLELRRYDADRVEGLPFTREELADMVGNLARIDVAERKKLPGLPPSRADIIVSGAALLVQLLEHLGIGEVTVSSRGLRHGLLFELVQGML